MKIDKHLLAALLTAVALPSSPLFAAQAPPGEDAGDRAKEPQKKAPPPRTSNRCYTPAANCVQFESARKGSSCWCVTPFGPSYGEIK